MTEDQYRRLLARGEANRFLVDALLRALFLELDDPKRRRSVADTMIAASMKTEQFVGVAKNDFVADRLADFVIQTQGLIQKSVEDALAATPAD